MTRRAFSPKIFITGEESVFVYHVLHEVAVILGINLILALTKHAQTMGVLEPADATIRTSLKMAFGKDRKQWQK